MKNFWTKIFVILSSAVTVGCSEPFEIPLSNDNIKPVVDGWIFDTDAPHLLLLSRTSEFGSNQFVPITGINAVITEVDPMGNITLQETLTEVSIEDVIEAAYISQNINPGKPGYTYKLDFEYNEKLYSAQSTMPQKVFLDTLNFEFRPGNTFQTEGFFPYITFQDPPGVNNFYLINVFRNDSLFFSANDIRIQSDLLFDGLYRKNRIGVRLRPGDTFRVDFICITRETFTFLSELTDQATGAGTIFDTPPANIQGNISNNGIGLFSAATIDTKTITLPE